jgi:hypothetical protein
MMAEFCSPEKQSNIYPQTNIALRMLMAQLKNSQQHRSEKKWRIPKQKVLPVYSAHLRNREMTKNKKEATSISHVIGATIPSSRLFWRGHQHLLLVTSNQQSFSTGNLRKRLCCKTESETGGSKMTIGTQTQTA